MQGDQKGSGSKLGTQHHDISYSSGLARPCAPSHLPLQAAGAMQLHGPGMFTVLNVI